MLRSLPKTDTNCNCAGGNLILFHGHAALEAREKQFGARQCCIPGQPLRKNVYALLLQIKPTALCASKLLVMFVLAHRSGAKIRVGTIWVVVACLQRVPIVLDQTSDVMPAKAGIQYAVAERCDDGLAAGRWIVRQRGR